MAHEHERWLYTCIFEQCMQLVNNLVHRARVRTELAPPVACAVVRADACELGDARLDEAPLDRKITDPRFEHDCRLRSAGFACAIDVKSPPAHIHQPAGRT